MRYLKPLALILIACAASLSASAQGSDPGKPAHRKFKHNSKIETIYDKDKNQTAVYLRPMSVRYISGPLEARIVNEGANRNLPAEALWMTAYFTYEGQSVSAPKAVIIGFQSMNLDKPKYTDNLRLTAKTDGSLLDFGSMKLMDRRVNDKMELGTNNYIMESFEAAIPIESFLHLTSAKKVKMMLGTTEFELSNSHLEALRDLASRMAN